MEWTKRHLLYVNLYMRLWSMKNSYDKVEASMSTSTSANAQMTKAQRRGKQQFQKNSNQSSKHRTWTSTDTQNYLTDYAAEMTEIETILSENLKVVQMSPNLFFVFSGDSTVPGKFWSYKIIITCNSSFGHYFNKLFQTYTFGTYVQI